MDNQIPGITLPQQTISQNQSQAKVLTKADLLMNRKTTLANNEFQTQAQNVYIKVGMSQTPIQNIQLVAVLLINEIETIFDFFHKQGDEKMQKCVDAVLGYLNYCGYAYDDIDRAYTQQICQLVFNQYSIEGIKQVAKEVYNDVGGCLRKKAAK